MYLKNVCVLRGIPFCLDFAESRGFSWSGLNATKRHKKDYKPGGKNKKHSGAIRGPNHDP